LISARATINSLEVLSLLMSSYLYILCQALDLRALHSDLVAGFDAILAEELDRAFGAYECTEDRTFLRALSRAARKTLDRTSTMDAEARMRSVVDATAVPLLEWLARAPCFVGNPAASGAALAQLGTFRENVAERATALLVRLRGEYLSGERGPAPAGAFLRRTRPVYEFVRVKLGVRMHGAENAAGFENGLGVDEESIGQSISRIHEVGFL
jgi:phenylalanine ammonia-lyase